MFTIRQLFPVSYDPERLREDRRALDLIAVTTEKAQHQPHSPARGL